MITRRYIAFLVIVTCLLFAQYKYVESKFEELVPVCPSPEALEFDFTDPYQDQYYPTDSSLIMARIALYELTEGERTYAQSYERLFL